MKEIIELNNHIRREMPELADAEEGLIVAREDQPSDWGALSAPLREHVERVVAELNRILPADFSYCLYLGDNDPVLGLSFQDGAQVETFRNIPCEGDESLAEAFSGIDWDDQRAAAMEECQTFDRMKEYAETVEPDIPKTKELHKEFRVEMKEWVKTIRKDATSVYAMMVRWEDEGIITEKYESLEDFSRWLPNLMTLRFDIIAVVADGKPLAAAKIDKLKVAALVELENMPISHAKASGKI
jgi:hypothetical protein